MEGQAENDELYPIAVLIDELKVSTIVVVTESARSRTFSPDLPILSAR